MVDTTAKPLEARASQRTPRGDDAGRVGRRVAWGLYWALAVFVCGAGLYAIIPQVFWPDATVPQVQPTTDCAAVLTLLADELAGHGALRPPERHTRLREWDRQYLSFHDACSREPAYQALYRARYAVETQASRVDDDVAPLLDEVRAALSSPAFPGDRR